MVQRSFLSTDSGNYLFKNNDIDSLVDKVKSYLKDSETKKIAQILSCKRN